MQDYDRHIGGAKLKSLLSLLDQSTDVFANSIGVGDGRTVRYWLKTGLPVKRAIQIAQKFGIDFDSFLLPEKNLQLFSEIHGFNTDNEIEKKGSFSFSGESTSALVSFLERNDSSGKQLYDVEVLYADKLGLNSFTRSSVNITAISDGYIRSIDIDGLILGGINATVEKNNLIQVALTPRFPVSFFKSLDLSIGKNVTSNEALVLFRLGYVSEAIVLCGSIGSTSSFNALMQIFEHLKDEKELALFFDTLKTFRRYFAQYTDHGRQAFYKTMGYISTYNNDTQRSLSVSCAIEALSFCCQFDESLKSKFISKMNDIITSENEMIVKAALCIHKCDFDAVRFNASIGKFG